MHISEGILSAPILASGWGVTIAGTAIGLKRLNFDRIMTVSLLSSTFFVASLIHVPAGVGSIHLLLSGLLGLLLRWSVFPAILVALLLQALFFQYGGLLVLGVNTAVIATPALVCGLIFHPWLARGKKQIRMASFSAGFLSILLSVICMGIALYCTDPGFLKAAGALLVTHIPIMAIEGCITMFVVGFLIRVEPEILQLTTWTEKRNNNA